MARAKSKAECRADTRGGPWAGIPVCVIKSPAYRSLSLHARAILVELVARMTGYNNGSIAVSQRELREALGCRPQRITDGLAELMEHALLDVTVEGKWKERQARQYRLTFVSTKRAGATNDYLRWTPAKEKSGVTDAVTARAQSATDAVTERDLAATDAVTARIAEWRKSVDRPKSAVTDVVTLISNHHTPAPVGERRGDDGSILNPPSASGVRCENETDCQHCEKCGGEIEGIGRGRYPKRFCSETCRKSAERARAYQRRKGMDEAAPIGAVIGGTVQRLLAGARA